jgi:dGTPase
VPPPLEAQIIDLVDEIAYNHHDLDDGFESRLLEPEAFAEAVPLFGRPYRQAQAAWPGQGPDMWIKLALRRVIDALASDLIATTQERIDSLDIRSVEHVRAQPGWLVGLSAPVARDNALLKQNLRGELYRHPRMNEARSFFAGVLEDLFEVYRAQPGEMPERFLEIGRGEGMARAACDYLAGMTDRFALQEHRRLCDGPGPEGAPVASR